jgi:hypothetical protein
MYGMKKTTLYFPEDLRASLERLSAEQGRSEAEIIRQALRSAVDKAAPPKPRLPLTTRGLGDPSVAERVDELLDGFGER